MNKEAKENLRLINADIEEGMDKKFIDIDWGLELHRLTKPIETALNEAEEIDKAMRIIVENQLDIFLHFMYPKTYEHYAEHCFMEKPIPKEDWMLVKGVIDRYAKKD